MSLEVYVQSMVCTYIYIKLERYTKFIHTKIVSHLIQRARSVCDSYRIAHIFVPRVSLSERYASTKRYVLYMWSGKIKTHRVSP